MFSQLGQLHRPAAASTTRWPPRSRSPLWRNGLRGLAEAEQQARACSTCCGRTWPTVLGNVEPDAIAAELAFSDHGFDSLTAVELRNRLKAATGLALSPTLIFDYPTPAALAGYIRQRARRRHPGRRKRRAAPSALSVIDEPIAIVGMSCRYPGGVDSPEALWDMVADGRDVLTDFPTDRGWDLAGLFNDDPDAPGKSYASTGGFLDDVADFDAERSSGSRRVRRWRWTRSSGCLLELSWEALERGGIDPLSCAAARPACSPASSPRATACRAEAAAGARASA